MCCGVVPILFGWFLRVPSVHALVFTRKTFCDLFIHHLLLNFSVAEELFMKSLKMYETLVGENHLKTLQPLKNLGTFYMQRNR